MKTVDTNFRKIERLKKASDIKALFGRANKTTCYGAKLLYLANDRAYNRVVFVPARKYGSSVKRNRAKRLGREAYWSLRQHIESGIDCAILLYPGTDSFEERVQQVKSLFSKAALYVEGI